MNHDRYNSLFRRAHDVLRLLVPEQEDRIPVTPRTGMIQVLCYVPFVVLAALARRPDTYFLRLLILPVVISLIIVAAYHFTWIDPVFNVYNWGQCKFATWAILGLTLTCSSRSLRCRRNCKSTRVWLSS